MENEKNHNQEILDTLAWALKRDFGREQAGPNAVEKRVGDLRQALIEFEETNGFKVIEGSSRHFNIVFKTSGNETYTLTEKGRFFKTTEKRQLIPNRLFPGLSRDRVTQEEVDIEPQEFVKAYIQVLYDKASKAKTTHDKLALVASSLQNLTTPSGGKD